MAQKESNAKESDEGTTALVACSASEQCGCRPIQSGLKTVANCRSANGAKKVQQRQISLRRVLATLRQYKQPLEAQYKISELGVFGSSVRGEHRKRSDIDILVDFHVVPDLLTFVRLGFALEEILHRKVDLVHKPSLREELKEQVLSEVVSV